MTKRSVPSYRQLPKDRRVPQYEGADSDEKRKPRTLGSIPRFLLGMTCFFRQGSHQKKRLQITGAEDSARSEYGTAGDDRNADCTGSPSFMLCANWLTA